jgi:hypothetical protein
MDFTGGEGDRSIQDTGRKRDEVSRIVMEVSRIQEGRVIKSPGYRRVMEISMIQEGREMKYPGYRKGER